MSGEGLVYGGARVGVRLVEGGVADAGVVLGRGWPSVVGVSAARRARVRRVCLRLWMTEPMRTARVCAARPNTRQDRGSKLPSSLIMPLTPSTGLRGCAWGGARLRGRETAHVPGPCGRATGIRT